MCCANVGACLLAHTAVPARGLAVRLALRTDVCASSARWWSKAWCWPCSAGWPALVSEPAILLVAPSWIPEGVPPAAWSNRVRCTRAGLLRGDLDGSRGRVRSRPGVAGNRRLARAGRHTRRPRRDTTRLGGPKRAGHRPGRRRGAAVVRRGVAAAHARHARAGQSRPSRPGSGMTIMVGPGWGRFPGGSAASTRLWSGRSGRPQRARRGVGKRPTNDDQWVLAGLRPWWGIPGEPPTERLSTGYQIVSPTYSTMGIAMLGGREFTNHDTSNSPQILHGSNQALVRRGLAGREPIGMRVSVNAMVQPSAQVTREMVGVVSAGEGGASRRGQARAGHLRANRAEHLVVGLVRRGAGRGRERGSGQPSGLPWARVDKGSAGDERPDVCRHRRRGHAGTAVPRSRCGGSFAAVAVVLAMVGVFGVLTCSVAQGGSGFGVRIAH